jgi:hypothetical protein
LVYQRGREVVATRKVAKKKSASVPSRPKKQTRVVPDALTSGEANDEAIDSKDASKVTKKPKVHAKVVSLIVSIGTEDRKRSHEDFLAHIMKKLGAVKASDPSGNRNPGIHATPTGGYYILDGKVCLPEDYDKKTGTFKKGATPPTWAGGPKHNSTVGAGNQFQYDLAHLSSDEYDKKYKVGKYTPKPDMSRLITPEMQKERREQWRKEKQQREEEGLDEFDWDEGDVEDTKKLSAAADESAKRAIKRMKSASKKPVKKTIKKSPQKKTVKRIKK